MIKRYNNFIKENKEEITVQKSSVDNVYHFYINGKIFGMCIITKDFNYGNENSMDHFFDSNGEKMNIHLNDDERVLRDIEIYNEYRGSGYGIKALKILMTELNITKLYLWSLPEHKLWNRIAEKTDFTLTDNKYLGKHQLFILDINKI